MMSMADLATKFCERAAEGSGMEIEPVAPFAKSVMERFADELGEGAKEAFRGHLVNSVGVEFHAWWQEVCNASRTPVFENTHLKFSLFSR